MAIVLIYKNWHKATEAFLPPRKIAAEDKKFNNNALVKIHKNQENGIDCVMPLMRRRKNDEPGNMVSDFARSSALIPARGAGGGCGGEPLYDLPR